MTLPPVPSTRAVVGLVVDPGESGVLRPLVRAMLTMAEVRSLGRCSRTPDAVLASSEAAAHRIQPKLARLLAESASQRANFAGGGDREVAVAVCGDVGIRVGDVLVPRPEGALDVSAVLPRGLLVRRRWQERLGRPDRWTIVADGVAAEDRPEALTVCSTAVVSESDLALALALGTPTVTSAAAARSVGAVDGEHVVVAGPADDPIVLASALAVDEIRAAALAAAGRRLAEDQLDIVALARRVLDLAGLASDPGLATNLQERLRELHTPPASRMHTRVASATAALTGAPA